MMEQGAAPAGGARTPRSREARESARGALGSLREELAGLGLAKASSQEARTRGLCLWRKPEARSRQWSAERRPCPSKEDTARREDPVRRLALHPLGFGRGEKRRRPARGRKEYGRFHVPGPQKPRLAPPKPRLYKPRHHSRGCLALGPDNGSKRPSGGPFTGLTHLRGGSTGEDYGSS